MSLFPLSGLCKLVHGNGGVVFQPASGLPRYSSQATGLETPPPPSVNSMLVLLRRVSVRYEATR